MKTFREFLNEQINLSKNHGLKYLDLIKKEIKAKKYDMIEDKKNDGLFIKYNTGLTFYMKDGSIVGFNTDGSDTVDFLPKEVNTFKLLQKNILLLKQFKSKPISNLKSVEPENVVSIKVQEEDLSQYGIKELRDGLTLEIIKEGYSWILKAKIKEAIIGIGINQFRDIVWYDGTWEKGTWEYGTWKDGTWKDGTWKNGDWKSGTWKNGTWKDGTWYDGTWEKGNWMGGTWYDGTWEDGTWKNGTWKDGTWEDGIWYDGIWLRGEKKKVNNIQKIYIHSKK